MVNVSPTTAVVTFVPPAIISVSVVVLATAEPESPVTVSHKFWSTLGLLLVIVKVSPATAVVMPVPPETVNVSNATFGVALPLSPAIVFHMLTPVTVIVSGDATVDTLVPPAIVSVSVGEDAVVGVPESPAKVS